MKSGLRNLLTLSLLSLTLPVTAQVRFTLRDLGPSDDTFNKSGTRSTAVSINNAGTILGWSGAAVVNGTSDPSLWFQATLWDNLGGINRLGAFPNEKLSFGWAQNDFGQVVGHATQLLSASPLAEADRAFLWDADNGLQEIGVLGTGTNSFAYGINNLGQVAGTSDITPLVAGDPRQTRAFVWDRDNGLQDIGTFGGDISSASGINDLGEVVGVAKDATNADFAFLWDSVRGLQSLGSLPNGTSSYATAINNQEQVIGASYLASGQAHAFLWTPLDGMLDIGTLPADTRSSATALNSWGQIIGESEGVIDTRQFLYHNGTMQDIFSHIINKKGWKTLASTQGINDRGQIVGSALTTKGKTHAVVLTPVPTFPNFDVNGDGKSDLLWQNTNTGDIAYWLMDGPNKTSTGSLGTGVPLEWRLVSSVDINGDGRPDLIWQSTKTGAITYWLMKGTKRVGTGWITHQLPLEWQLVSAIDLNGDGQPDLLFQNAKTGAVAYWYMNGIIRTQFGLILTSAAPEWKLVTAADLDGDGKPDLLWQNTLTGDVVYWLMNGVTRTDDATLTIGLDATRQLVGTADIDKDGSPDLIWQDMLTGGVYYTLQVNLQTGNSGTIVASSPLEWKVSGLR